MKFFYPIYLLTISIFVSASNPLVALHGNDSDTAENSSVKNNKTTSKETSFEDDDDVLILYDFTGEVLNPSVAPLGATTSDFQVTGTTPTFNSNQASSWSGSGVPVAQSGSDWGEDNPDDAKYFFFTVNADDGFEMDVNTISFEWRSTGNGPSAITVEINGTEIETFDAPANETTSFSSSLSGFENLNDIEVRIKGWDNESRDTPGTGILRVNDVRLDGEINATTSVLVTDINEINELNYIEGSGPSNPQSFALSGSNLDETDVDASLPNGTNFEIATEVAGPYSESINLASYDGEEVDIYIRLKSGLLMDSYNDILSISGGGADTVTIDISGEVIENIFLIYEFTGEVLSPTQSPMGATTSDFQVTGTTPTFNSNQASSWSGSGVPVAQSGSDWGEDNPDDAKYFFFNVNADDGFEMDVSTISFQWRSTGNGPSAITVEINGTEIETFNAPANETTSFSSSLSGFENLSDIEVRIKGWDNESRDTPGTGILRVNDVRLDGEIYATTSVLVTDTNNISELNYVEGNGPSVAQSFILSGIDLDGTDVSVGLASDSGFEIANNIDDTYSSSFTIPDFDGNETSVYIRLKENLQPGMYDDNLTISGGGADPISLNVSGEVLENVFILYDFIGNTFAPSQFPENATTSDFQVSIDDIGFGNAQSDTWSAGSGVPYANSQTNWDETDVADAKYFFFNIAADDGFEMEVTNISFEWRATGNGPSAITVEINGVEIETFDAVENTTSVFSSNINNASSLNDIEIRIKGWDNGSRTTNGGGFFRINDVRLDGEIEPSLSIDEFNLAEQIQIYPNPVQDKLTIDVAAKLNQHEIAIEIYNLIGKKVAQHKFSNLNTNALEVDTNNLKTGMYLLKINLDNKMYTKKFIKK